MPAMIFASQQPAFRNPVPPVPGDNGTLFNDPANSMYVALLFDDDF